MKVGDKVAVFCKVGLPWSIRGTLVDIFENWLVVQVKYPPWPLYCKREEVRSEAGQDAPPRG